MSWIVLIVIILSVSINGQRILTPPKNYTGIIGESAEFKCHVELDIYQTVMSWEFNNDPVYIYQYGAIEYPKDREKYIGNHTKKRDAFTLAVMNLSHSDVGWYKCVVVSIEKSALLLVLDKPKIHIPNNNPVAGSKAQYICKAGFAGPSTENIALAQYPQLRMILDGNLLDGSIEEKTDSSGYHRQFTRVHEVKLEAGMNKKIMICDLGTSSPPTHVNVTAEMMVLYPVRSITYTPKNGQCEIGTEIICTADGNPEPYFLWDNIENIGNSIEGPLLNITKQMIGENNWRCTATNALGGRSYQESVIAAFKVVYHQEEGNATDDLWKIAVVITIPICIIIGSLVAVLLYFQLRCKRPPPSNRGETDLMLHEKNSYSSPDLLLQNISMAHFDKALVKEDIREKPNLYRLSGDGKSESIAEVLAWAYYFNYINIIGPGMVQRIEYFKEVSLKTEKNPVVLLPRKLFILLPSSCCGHPKLDDADSAIKSAGKLRFKHQIAGNNRNYDTAVYEITGEGKTYHACVEYCTPVLAIHETAKKGIPGFSEFEEMAQLYIFYELLKAILNLRSSRQFCRDFKLVSYNDGEKEKKLSEILVEQIKECLETESKNSDFY